MWSPSRRELLATAGGIVGAGALPGTTAGTRTQGAAHSVTQTGWGQQAKLVPEDGDPGEFVGDSVAVAGDTALVAARYDENPNGERTGSVYVFERSDDEWRQTTRLLPDQQEGIDGFEGAVALSGDTALVGAYSFTQDGETLGVASVYERGDGGWTRTETLLADDGDPEDGFGRSVALSGDTAVVGADNDADPNGNEAGSAYVFERADGEWSQAAKLVPDDGDPEDSFGRAVAAAEGVALVGASDDADPNGEGSGSAYVFERAGGEWTQTTKLAPGDLDEQARFGFAVALAAETALVGAYRDGNPNGALGGSAYVFDGDDGWSQQAKLAPENGGEEDLFGVSVALDGDTALIGASIDADPNGERAGSAFVFDGTDGWTQRAKLLPEDGDDRDEFGYSVALSGETALVGAIRDEHPNGRDAGSAYVFTGGRPVQSPTATPTPPDPGSPTPATASPTPGTAAPTPVEPSPQTATPTPAGPATASTATPTATDTPATDGGSGGADGDDEDDGETTTGSGPGLGVGGALAAVAAAVGLGWWRGRDS